MTILHNCAVQPGWLTRLNLRLIEASDDFIDNMGRNEKYKSLKHRTTVMPNLYPGLRPASFVANQKLPSTRPKTREMRQKTVNIYSTKFKLEDYRSPSGRCALNDLSEQPALPAPHHSLIK